MSKSTKYADAQKAKLVSTKPKASGNSKYALKQKQNARDGVLGFMRVGSDNTNGNGVTEKYKVSSNMRRFAISSDQRRKDEEAIAKDDMDKECQV
jgi:hypothetical protein